MPQMLVLLQEVKLCQEGITVPAIILKLLIGTIIPIGKEHKDNKK